MKRKQEQEKEKWSLELCLSGLRWRCPLNHQSDKQTWPAAVWHWHIPSQHYTPPHTSCFPSLFCALPRLWNLFSSLLFFLWFCAVSCLILHFSDLFSSLSHTAFYCFVVLSSIKQGEHVIVLTTHPLCATAPEALSQQRILEEYEHRAKGKDKWIFNKQKQAGWLTEKCGFYNRKPDTSVLQSIQTQARGSACTVPPLKFRLLYSSKGLTSDSSWDFI